VEKSELVNLNLGARAEHTDGRASRVQKNPGFLKKSPTQWVFGFFLDKQEKIGKTIQKRSNLKP